MVESYFEKMVIVVGTEMTCLSGLGDEELISIMEMTKKQTKREVETQKAFVIPQSSINNRN